MIDLSNIDQIDEDALSKKYALLDRISARELAQFGYYLALDEHGGSMKSRLGKERLNKNKKESIEKVESRLEEHMESESSRHFIKHMEKIIKQGESDKIVEEPDKIVEEAHRYCAKNNIDNKTVRENLIIFCELVSFGYRYRLEDGLSESKNVDKGPSESEKEEAKKAIKAVESNDNNGVAGMMKSIFGL